jgi:cytochrome c biogenesis protein CcmG/thiol:disulfide interchange protein DsbE
MNWKRSLIGLSVALPIVLLLGYGLGKDPRFIQSPLPGKPAPQFALPMLETSDTMKLTDVTGSVAVVNFWASWCIPCREEHPVLLEGARTYLPKGVKFIGVTYNDQEADSKAWLKEMGQAYPSLVDKGARVAIDYGVAGVPETFILDKHGVVAFKKFGPITSAELAQKLDSLLNAS